MRLKRLVTAGRSLRKTPQGVAAHSRPRWSTKPRWEVSQGSPSAAPTIRIPPFAGSMRTMPPGFTTAQMAPSEVSPSHRTLPPPKPAFLVQTRGARGLQSPDARPGAADGGTQGDPYRSLPVPEASGGHPGPQPAALVDEFPL